MATPGPRFGATGCRYRVVGRVGLGAAQLPEPFPEGAGGGGGGAGFGYDQGGLLGCNESLGLGEATGITRSGALPTFRDGAAAAVGVLGDAGAESDGEVGGDAAAQDIVAAVERVRAMRIILLNRGSWEKPSGKGSPLTGKPGGGGWRGGQGEGAMPGQGNTA